MKHCIFHVPFYIDPNWISASHLRPMKMIDAFKNIGYQVEVISGYGKQRKDSIENIKRMINSGIKFEFMYSESSTMPTLLTEKNHLPMYPCLDFNFMKFCKKSGIKIALFYRDMYWAFPRYRNSVSRTTSLVTIPLYKYDLKQYEKLVDILYLPSLRMARHIEPYASISDIRVLPPGGLEHIDLDTDDDLSKSHRIQLVYVGAIGGDYNLKNIFEAASECPRIDFNFCLKAKDWNKEKSGYEGFLDHENIKIFHLSGDQLDELLHKMDVAINLLSWEDYIKMAVPYKFFEYVSYGLPVIGPSGTAVGDFIQENDCGWTVTSDKTELVNLLDNLADGNVNVTLVKKNTRLFASRNRWIDRANQVVEDVQTIY